MNHFRFDICPCCNAAKKEKAIEDPFSFEVDLSEQDIEFIAENALKEMKNGQESAPQS